ncbi:hypothetical protein [Aquitalea magnusonii]|uniref:hypothetical protein n=1 Tax=Aquitalea magnusonii TaxID=332411 RepID=UPI000B5CE2B2|nr:hypothetical protein [Aquitalea magnusonii]
MCRNKSQDLSKHHNLKALKAAFKSINKDYKDFSENKHYWLAFGMAGEMFGWDIASNVRKWSDAKVSDGKYVWTDMERGYKFAMRKNVIAGWIK